MKNLIFFLLGIGANVFAARHNPCEPPSNATCYCLGPENYGVNAPTSPKTCNDDLTMTMAAFYWNAHQDGMEYAIDNQVKNPGKNPNDNDIKKLNNITSAEYKTPRFQWDFGCKVGLDYCAMRDGWDLSLLWTWYQGKANDHIEREIDDNATLLALWSAFAPAQGFLLYATDMKTRWNLQLNLVDIELGRNFWSSKYLALRPFVGLRGAFLGQGFQIQHKGGSWAALDLGEVVQEPFNNYVKIKNNFKGIGLRSGLHSIWSFGSGWAFYANSAVSMVYGRFYEGYDEVNRLAISPHSKTKIANYNYSFRASRAMFDFALGVQWSTMPSDCKYGFSIALGWEQHLFFDQNQMQWISRIGDTSHDLPNNDGENIFEKRRGNLDTQGFTLTGNFTF